MEAKAVSRLHRVTREQTETSSRLLNVLEHRSGEGMGKHAVHQDASGEARVLREDLHHVRDELDRVRAELMRSQRSSESQLQESRRSVNLNETRLMEATRDCDRYKDKIAQLELDANEREDEMNRICSELMTAEQGLHDANRQLSLLRRERDAASSEASECKREIEDLQAAVQSLKGIVRSAESQAERESHIAEQARKASLTLQEELNDALRALRSMTESMTVLRENHNSTVEQHEADIFHISKLRAELEACRSQMDSFNQEKRSGLARSTRYLGESWTPETRASAEALEMQVSRDLKDAARALDMIHSSVCGAVSRAISPNRSKLGGTTGMSYAHKAEQACSAVNDLTDELSRLQKQLFSVRGQVVTKSGGSDLRASSSEVESLMSQVCDLNQLLEDANQSRNEMQKKMSMVQRNLDTAIVEKEAKDRECESSVRELQRTRASLREEEGLKMELMREQTEMVADLEKAARRILDLERNISSMSNEINIVLEEVESVRVTGERKLSGARDAWEQEAKSYQGQIWDLRREVTEANHGLDGLRAELDRLKHEQDMEAQDSESRVREIEVKLSETILSWNAEREQTEYERQDHVSTLEVLRNSIRDLEHDRKEYLWVTDKLQKAADMSANRDPGGAWQSELRLQSVEAGGERLQSAATDIDRLLQFLKTERNYIVELDEGREKFRLRVKELERAHDVLQSDAGRFKIEAEEAQRGLKAARELVEDLKIRLVDKEASVRDGEVAAWQEERHHLEMTMQELRTLTTERHRDVVELQRQLEFERSERDKIRSQRQTASDRRVECVVRRQGLSLLKLCMMAMHESVWRKRKLERRLMLIYRRGIRAILSLWFLRWVREVDDILSMRSKAVGQGNNILRRVVKTIFSAWQKPIQRAKDDITIVNKFRRRWARPALLEVAIAFSKWAADSVASQALAKARWEKLAVSAAVEKLHNTCNSAPSTKIGLKQLLLSSSISSRAPSHLGTPVRTPCTSTQPATRSLGSSPTKTPRSILQTLTNPRDEYQTMSPAFTNEPVHEEDPSLPLSGIAGGDRMARWLSGPMKRFMGGDQD